VSTGVDAVVRFYNYIFQESSFSDRTTLLLAWNIHTIVLLHAGEPISIH